MRPGEVYFHRDFYIDRETGGSRGKYLLALAILPGDDIVFRLLTSRPHGRPEVPPCYHGDPYPGFFLGVPGPPLNSKTWVDLRGSDDYDGSSAAGDASRKILTPVMALNRVTFRSVLACAAAANDTTGLQERAIRDQMAELPL